MVFFFPSDPVEAPESNDIALRLAYTELIQLKQPGELVDRDGIIQQEETNLFDTHFPTAVGIQVLHGTTPLLALEIDMTYDPDHIMPVVGTATVFLDPYHMQLGFTLNNIVDTSTMLIDVSLDLR